MTPNTKQPNPLDSIREVAERLRDYANAARQTNGRAQFGVDRADEYADTLESALAELEGEGHVLDVRDDGWAIEHPRRCRDTGSLLDCPAHNEVQGFMAAFDSRPLPVGRYPFDEISDLPTPTPQEPDHAK